MLWPWLTLTYSCSSCPEDSCSSSPLHSNSWTLSGASFVIGSGKCFPFLLKSMQLRSTHNFKYIRNRRIVLHQFSQHGELKLNILVIGSQMRIFQIFMRPNSKQSKWNFDKNALPVFSRKQRILRQQCLSPDYPWCPVRVFNLVVTVE